VAIDKCHGIVGEPPDHDRRAGAAERGVGLFNCEIGQPLGQYIAQTAAAYDPDYILIHVACSKLCHVN
jgi:hypothetical protein